MVVASEAGVRAVAAVEGDAFPIHKIPRGRRGHAHGVVIVNHPRAAFAHAAGTVIEAYREALLRDVPRRDLIGPKQHGPEIHPAIGRHCL